MLVECLNWLIVYWNMAIVPRAAFPAYVIAHMLGALGSPWLFYLLFALGVAVILAAHVVLAYAMCLGCKYLVELSMDLSRILRNNTALCDRATAAAAAADAAKPKTKAKHH